MAGTWKTQNKRRPGAYINVKGAGQPISDSPLGRLLMVSNVNLRWGREGVIPLTNSSDFKAELGTTLNDPDLVALKEALKGAETVLFINTNSKSGRNATANSEKVPWGFVAKYPGERGNDISVSIEPEVVEEGQEPTKATVTTLFDNSIVDQQVISSDNLEGFVNNDYVIANFQQGSKLPTSSITLNLSNGFSNQADLITLVNNAMETENYSVVTTAGMEISSNVHKLLVESVKRLREDQGMKVRAVIPVNDTAPVYNYEGVSMVANGFIEGDGTRVNTTNAAAFFAGISSAADAGTALTYYDVSDAIEAYPKLNNEKTIAALNAGKIVFTTRPGQRVVVEQDINSLVKFTVDRPKVFSKNRVIRTIDDICTNTQEVFENSFLGKVGNNTNGRDLFKANRIAYLMDLQARNIIQNFTNDDISVEKGNDSDSIVVDLAVEPVDAMEKLYMTLIVK
ncbi:phage tail sheath family protein [Lactobacillus sp. PSON]|uniref:phage tail sheath family protein n=1 Tax=Lactobacillus sp. PSON TaxID=3455454 RepID=UPI004042A9AB